jgi:acetyl esterase/lipase
VGTRSPAGPAAALIAAAAAVVLARRVLREHPWPFAFVVRVAFARGGRRTADALAKHVPASTSAVLDERYDDGSPDTRLDVYFPAGASKSGEPLPAVVWVHGGGWVAGSKEELANYFRILASYGYAVAGIEYSLAPRAVHPTQARQVMTALAHLRANAERLRIDASRIVLAGDSGGAQIAAQVANLVTSEDYAGRLGIPATISPAQLKGVVLCCGAYELTLRGSRAARGRRFTHASLTRYAGTSRYASDPTFALASVRKYVTGSFPPAFVTAGNADPLLPESEALAGELRARGVAVDTLFFPSDHEPPAGHEYQFDLDREAGRLALARMTAFVGEVCDRQAPG